MKKVLGIGIMLLIMLVGCSNDTAAEDSEQKAEQNEQSDEVTEDPTEDQTKDKEPLPFDVNEVVDEYEAVLQTEPEATITADDSSISIANSGLREANMFLQTLNDYIGDGDLLSISADMTNSITEEGFYTEETTIENVTINIKAVDDDLIAINVTKE